MDTQRKKASGFDDLPLLQTLKPSKPLQKGITAQAKTVVPVPKNPLSILESQPQPEVEKEPELVRSVLAQFGNEVVPITEVWSAYGREDGKLASALAQSTSGTDIISAFDRHPWGSFLDALALCPSGELDRLAQLVADYTRSATASELCRLRVLPPSLKRRTKEVLDST